MNLKEVGHRFFERLEKFSRFLELPQSRVQGADVKPRFGGGGTQAQGSVQIWGSLAGVAAEPQHGAKVKIGGEVVGIGLESPFKRCFGPGVVVALQQGASVQRPSPR